MKKRFKIKWEFKGYTLIDAKDEREAQQKFDKMDAKRLFSPRQMSLYGHGDSDWEFQQIGDPSA